MKGIENKRKTSICKIAGKIYKEYFKTKIIRVLESTILFCSVFEIQYFNFIINEIPLKRGVLVMLSMLVYSNQHHFQVIFFHYH